MPNPCPIGLFDSGVGGLTVWREVARVLPNEDLIYFADQAQCPYGSRPPAEIRILARRAADFLLQHDAKAIVVACNKIGRAHV
jgi:glutamate racemase